MRCFSLRLAGVSQLSHTVALCNPNRNKWTRPAASPHTAHCDDAIIHISGDDDDDDDDDGTVDRADDNLDDQQVRGGSR